ncbi:hypothetical protein BDW62DRAFT_187787 [Aspergillus aurantiobrunneus]
MGMSHFQTKRTNALNQSIIPFISHRILLPRIEYIMMHALIISLFLKLLPSVHARWVLLGR